MSAYSLEGRQIIEMTILPQAWLGQAVCHVQWIRGAKCRLVALRELMSRSKAVSLPNEFAAKFHFDMIIPQLFLIFKR
jgi:hypothetical protein